MAIARRNLVDSETPGFYHCISRCVRRAYLCGDDPVTGHNYDYRKDWLEKRMLALAEIFSISLYAYAVMDNHYHLVLYLDPKGALNWSDEQVAERWLRAYPGKLDEPKFKQQRELKKQAIINDPERLNKYRQRLSSLSWFMSRLNEPLAKLSNAQDNVKGRFWESRYQSIALLDETAVLACMAYVDLNPIRAGIAQELEASLHTSIKKRIEALVLDATSPLISELKAIAGAEEKRIIQVNLDEYIELVEWTGKTIVHPHKAKIPPHITSIFYRLNLQQNNWLTQIQQLGRHQSRAMGSIKALRRKAIELKQKWINGLSVSRQLYRTTE